MKRHIDEQNGDNSEPEFCMSLAVETDHNVTGHIDEDRPSQIVYPGAWDSADLRLGIWRGRSARIEKVVDITSMPAGDSEFVDYSFLVRSSTAQVLAGPDHNISPWNNGHAELIGAGAFVALTGSQLRGMVLRTPVAWYYVNGEMVRVPVTVSFDIQADGETVRATKHIPRSLIADALAVGSHLFTDATFVPDASPEIYGCDGQTRRNGAESWSAKRDGDGLYAGDASSSEVIQLSMHSTTNNYDMIKRIFSWTDTSSIGAGQVIDSGDWAFTTSNVNSGSLGMEVNICGSTSSNTTSVAAADYQTASFSPLYSDTSITATSAGTFTRNSLTLNQDGKDAVNVTGLTRFCLGCSNYDFADVEPTWVSNGDQQLGVYMSEQGTAGRDPELTVTHSEPSAGGGVASSGSFGNSVSLSTGL